MMRISDLFDVYSGSKLDFGKQIVNDLGINFVSRNSNNNGVVGKITLESGMKSYKKGDITVPLGGSYLLSAFVQDEDFVTAQNVHVLRAKKEMSDIEKWFFCYVLRENRFKFSAFGREVNKYLKDIEIPSKIPKWIYYNKFDVLKTNVNQNIIEFDTSNWKKFKFNDIFIIKKGFFNKKPTHYLIGEVPFIGATAKNNGVTEYYSLEDIDNATKTGKGKNVPISQKLFPANAVCVANNGCSAGYAFYQPKEFTCSHDVNPLYIKNGEFTPYTGIFVSTVIILDRYRWDFGRKWRPQRMKDSVIKLPHDKNGDPDWMYMENYIKRLPYSDKL